MNEIEKLKTKIEEAINDIPESVNVFGHINKETLQSSLKRLQNIDEILEQDKYNITFIGTVGAGKTTVISHLFNLTRKTSKTITKKGKERKIEDVIEPLLSTGSGRTTICEVVINFSDTLSIEIDPYTKYELKKEIDYFCDSFYEKEENADKENSISAELERAIRSVIGLKKNTSSKENTDIKIDEAKEKAKELSADKFKEYAINNAKLDNRVYTRSESKLECTQQDSKKWIKDNFTKVNRAAISSFSIPKKIYLNINKDIYGESGLDIFNSIIDTKGIDENPIREDLINQIDDENTIIVFTSSYNDAPKSDIRELIEHALSKKSKRYQDRFVLLVMPRHNEPEHENDGDGSWENGVLLKKEIIKKIFKEKKLDFIEDNILFYDALQFYDSEGRIDRDYKDDIQEEKSQLLKNFEEVIKKRKNNLKEEIKQIEKSCFSIQSGEIELTKENEQAIELLENNLQNIKNIDKRIPSYVYEEFIDSYIGYYATRYKAWNTKDAIHRRLGVFSERGFSTYFDAKIVAEGITENAMLHKFTKDLKEEVEKSITKLGSDIPQLSEITPAINKLFEAEYDVFIDSVGSRIKSFLEKENRNEEFWSDMIDRRGKGRGYNDDVAKMLKNKLKTLRNGLSIDGVYRDYVESEWEKLIDKILIFFKK